MIQLVTVMNSIMAIKKMDLEYLVTDTGIINIMKLLMHTTS